MAGAFRLARAPPRMLMRQVRRKAAEKADTPKIWCYLCTHGRNENF